MGRAVDGVAMLGDVRNDVLLAQERFDEAQRRGVSLQREASETGVVRREESRRREGDGLAVGLDGCPGDARVVLEMGRGVLQRHAATPHGAKYKLVVTAELLGVPEGAPVLRNGDVDDAAVDAERLRNEAQGKAVPRYGRFGDSPVHPHVAW